MTALEEAKGKPEKEITAIKQENKVVNEAPRCSEENMDNVEVSQVDSKVKKVKTRGAREKKNLTQRKSTG